MLDKVTLPSILKYKNPLYKKELKYIGQNEKQYKARCVFKLQNMVGSFYHA